MFGHVYVYISISYVFRSFFSQAIELVKESNCGVPGADRKLQQVCVCV